VLDITGNDPTHLGLVRSLCTFQVTVLKEKIKEDSLSLNSAVWVKERRSWRAKLIVHGEILQ
jgi:hypothetical protein